MNISSIFLLQLEYYLSLNNIEPRSTTNTFMHLFKGIQAVRIKFFFILKVANIRCFILFAVEIFNICAFFQQTISHMRKHFTEWGHCVGHQWSYSWIYEYYSGKHWMLYWMQENQTATYFLRSRLFTFCIRF
jgi:hypothetical protein